MVQQESCDLHMAVHGRLHQGGVHLVGFVLLISTGIQQKLHNVQVSCGDSHGLVSNLLIPFQQSSLNSNQVTTQQDTAYLHRHSIE